MLQPFNLNQSRKGYLEGRREVLQFKINGQSGELNHLINHRRVMGPNSSMVAFETGLRVYNTSKGRKVKQSEEPLKPDPVQDRPQFKNTPKIDRQEFPSFLLSPKEAEQRKKQSSFYLRPGLFKSTDSPPGKLIVSAQ